MTLLSVKLYDKSYKEICSSISFSSSTIYKYSEQIRILERIIKENEDVQGFIYKNNIISYTPVIKDFLLVAVATTTTSLSNLNHFLMMFKDSVVNSDLLKHSNPSSEEFQLLCDSVLNIIDSTPRLTISLLGLERSGKTSFINYFEEDSPLGVFGSYEPTNLLNIINIDNIYDLPFKLRFFDLGMAYKQQWYKFSQESDGYIFFIDISDPKQINRSKELFQEIRNFWDLPFVIAANKRDASQIVNINKYVSRKLRVPSRIVYEIETMTGYGIRSLIEGLVGKEIHTQRVAVSIKKSR